MTKFQLLAATALVLAPGGAWAQTTSTSAPVQSASPAAAEAPQDDPGSGIQDIVVTAQRQAETLQQVPIAVSAFNAQALQAQQINTTSDLQLTLPNVVFSKSNFTSTSSFTIRGIGDLCVGVSCDAATAIHVNDIPIQGSPIFQNEYFDVERIEVLRGPQGTLFGRNATAGVINFISAKPDLSGIHASGDVEYGNFESLRVRGMLNVPLGDIIGVRVAGYYLKRDGFTKNLFDGKNIDGRDQYNIRASLRFEPTSNTTLDIVGSYFKEDDDRSRIQKQLCNRDPSGVLGCLPDRLAFGQLNGDATLAAVVTSTEFLNLRAQTRPLAGFALGSIYSTDGDVYSNAVNPADMRTVNVDSLPRFRTTEKQIQAILNHDFGPVAIKIDGGYTEGSTDSTVDYNIGVERSFATNPGLNAFNAAAGAGLLGPGYLAIRNALLPNGNTSTICQSTSDPSGTGVYGGNRICAPTSLDFDRSNISVRQFSVESVVSTKLDGMFNFLIGGIYFDNRSRDNNYYVNAFGLDYASGLLGGGTGYLAPPFYRSETQEYRLKSYGIFGESYVAFNDDVKLTLGLRYNNDRKRTIARLLNPLSFPAALGTTNAFTTPGYLTGYDADPSIAGNQLVADKTVSFGRVTGRAVLDWRITSRNLLYASFARGYKSGGLNPPLPQTAGVPQSFRPESVNAFEIGSKNTFVNGQLRLNLTGFYYQYKDLQLSRIVSRTAVNDNIDADIYGVEAEATIAPVRNFVVNLNASYLHTRIKSTDTFVNAQNPSGDRADAVTIKDLTNASNCAVTANNGSAALSNGFVTAVNSTLGLRAPTAVAGNTGTLAFSVCDALASTAAAPPAALSAALGLTAGAAIPITVNFVGVPVSVKGNELPQSPHIKFGGGVQYTAEFGNGFSLVPRVDLTYTGEYYATIFNRNVNRIQGFEVVNAQVQLNAPDNRFFVRAFVQNLTANDAITGLYVTDQSSGLFTNAFTLEPRRYGVAAGFKF